MTLPDTYQVHTSCSHIRDIALHLSEPFSSVFQSLLLQHHIYLLALLLRHLAASCRRCVCICAVGEIPEQGLDIWEQLHLDGGGSTLTLMFLPVYKLAWLCFQSVHYIYKYTVSCLARTAAIFPLQPSCSTKR